MLDERGMEWWAEDDPEEPSYYFVTKWFANGCEQTYEEIPAIRSRSLKAYCVTPEQAIAATLGRETCHNVYGKGHFKCSECGHYTQARMVYRDGTPAADPRFCPWCGREVVDDG